ncbi:MAG: orotidine-5'-phosphate decarboxylase [Coriobacteriales bacterium]|nr:orotidine-5'-phosphate decarboxylase [Coriobacteriales bacterium]
MNISELKAADRLICALDTPDVEQVKAIINDLDGVVSFFKIGITLHLASGLEIVKLLLNSGKKVFLDLKYYDVPETVRLAVSVAAKLGVTFLTIHGNSAIIKGAVEGRGASDLQLLVVTVLTSLDQDDLKEMGQDVALERLVLARAGLALSHGANGVISSAREAGLIKSETNGKLLVISPGIRDADAGDDQKRTMGAEDAIRAGADFLVVGRPITKATNRREAAQRHIAAIERGLRQRD